LASIHANGRKNVHSVFCIMLSISSRRRSTCLNIGHEDISVGIGYPPFLPGSSLVRAAAACRY